MRKATQFFILLITVTAGVIFLATAAQALFYNPDLEIAAPQLEAQAVALRDEQIGLPARLRIPSIEVDAAVQHVGINAKGNMATPSNFKDVAWYKYGPAPGASGSAVVAGHLDNGLGRPAVFWRLRDLQAGDTIEVTGEDGVIRRFVVTGAQIYPYKNVPTGEIFDPSGNARLALITCAGTWIPKEKTYDQRLVVFAEPVL